jgi:hypothetical protein
LAEKHEALGKNLLKCDFDHDKSHMGCPITDIALAMRNGLSAALPAVSIQAVRVWL